MMKQGIHLAERQEGFTLVELLVAIATFAMIMIGIFYLWRGDQIAYLQGSEAAEIQQNARAAMEQMVHDIRLAGYDPCRYVSETPAPNPAGSCTDAPGANALNTRSAFDPVRAGIYPIPIYTSTSIQVRMDRDGNGNTNGDNENVTYTYDAGGQRLLRNLNDGSDAQELARRITSFELRYYDGSQPSPVEVAPGGGTAAMYTIRLVRIRLTAQENFLNYQLTVNLQSDARLRDR